MIWLYCSAAMMVATGFVHSIVGQKLLITPILQQESEIMTNPLARQVLWFAWHLTTLLMWICAAIVIWPGVPNEMIILTGAVWLVVGLFDAIYTRGKHLGWPMLFSAGLLALVGAAG